MFEPINAVALVCHRPADFIATCFAFRQRTIFLTAEHAIHGIPAGDLYLLCQAGPQGGRLNVEAITVHPKADVAIIRTSEPGLAYDPFPLISAGRYLGHDYLIYGFPEDLLLPPYNPPYYSPDGRMLKGFFQRFMTHRLQSPYEYLAAEVSVACPKGLSGAPVFMQEAPMLVGLVTGEFETTTPHGTVISYGIAALLDDLRVWLDQQIPSVKT